MKYRLLGKTGLQVSVIGIGTWQLGGEWGRSYTPAEAGRILAKAKDCGINLIDTAECYGEHESERLIGQFLKRDNRADWVIATKFGHAYDGSFKRIPLWSASDVRQQLEDSLQALGTDYIDLYQFHSGTDEQLRNDALWTMLDKQVQAGTIRHLGISLGSNDNLEQTLAAADFNVGAVQLIYNRLDRKAEAQVLPYCAERRLGVLARVPLASGFLSGKYAPGAVFDASDVRNQKDRHETDRLLREVEAIRLHEVPDQVPMAEWALGWCLKHPVVSCVIPGCKDEAQVVSNAKAAAWAEDDHPLAWTAGKGASYT